MKKRFLKSILYLASITLVVVLVIQLAFISGAFWLRGTSGQSFIESQIQAITAGTDYKIKLSKFNYTFPTGIKISRLEIYDHDILIADITRLVLRPQITNLGLRSLKLSLSAQEATLHNLPAPPDPKTPAPTYLEPFSLPDLYFESLALDSVNIQNLVIKQAAFGTELKLAPQFKVQIGLKDEVTFKASLTPNWNNFYAPQQIETRGTFSPKTLDFTLSSFDISAENYALKASGQGNIGQDGTLDIKAQGKLPDISAFSADATGAVDLNAQLTGRAYTPALNLRAVINSDMLSEQNLSAVTLTAHSPDITGALAADVVVNTTYDQSPLTVDANILYAKSNLAINNIKGNGLDAELTGVINLDSNTMLGRGQVTLKARDISKYKDILEADISGALQAQLNLGVKDGAQSYSFSSSGKTLRYDDLTIKTAALDITPKGKNVYNVITRVNHIALAGTDLSADLTGGLNVVLPANIAPTRSNIKIQDIDLRLKARGEVIHATGEITQERLNLDIITKGFDAKALPYKLPAQLNSLKFSGGIEVRGSAPAPVVTAHVKTTSIRPTYNSQFLIKADAIYQNSAARLNINATGSSINQAEAHAEIPIHLSFLPFTFDVDQDTPVSGTLNLDARAHDLAKLFLPPGHVLRGKITGDGRLTGTVSNPDLTGGLSLTDGYYRFDLYDASFHDLNIKSRLDKNRLILNTLTANDGGAGRLSGKGAVYFTDTEQTSLDLQLKNFALLKSEDASAQVSADLAFKGLQNPDYILEGVINLGKMDIAIPEHFQTNIPKLNIVKKKKDVHEAPALNHVRLDVKIQADDQIFVRGWGLDAEFGGKLELNNTLSSPKVFGNFTSRRGRYEEFGKRFKLERAILRFQGDVPPSPYLDIIATTSVDGLDASVNLTGEVSNPEISFSSVPSLPEDEVLSRILFGENLGEISPFQAIQLKRTLDRFSGKGSGFDPLGTIRNATGLDDLSVEVEDGQTSIGVGKYITDKIYLELGKGGGEATGKAKVQIEVTPKMTVESEIGEDTNAGVGTFWRWDY